MINSSMMTRTNSPQQQHTALKKMKEPRKVGGGEGKKVMAKAVMLTNRPKRKTRKKIRKKNQSLKRKKNKL